ncbi:MAG: protein-methionine-sulfoxide reductase catalytic subunit MsrP, partial [Planctomycetota bacterium]
MSRRNDIPKPPSDLRVTDEDTFRQRRRLIQAMGAGAIAAGLGGAMATILPVLGQDMPDNRGVPDNAAAREKGEIWPPTRNPDYADAGRPITKEDVAGKYNNFYEFSLSKDVWQHCANFKTRPWTIEVGGLCNKPKTFDIDDLLKTLTLEERVYRFRCVEAWAMVVPWSGVPLKALLDKVEPLSTAKFVRFVSVKRPTEMPEQREGKTYAWKFPYYEGLRMAEAMHPLTLLTLGVYGKPLPTQHGAPVRVITPWKYGYKSPKSIVKIELVAEQPKTFWNDLQPGEYSFLSNVNPEKPHPRWSQATERMIDTGERVKTLLYNGYADQVGKLYAEG